MRSPIRRFRLTDMGAPPVTRMRDLCRLVASLLGKAVLHPRDFSAEGVFRAWARGIAARHGSEDLVVDLGIRKVLLVGSSELSRAILARAPSREGFAAGTAKRLGMGFLAGRALTISDDAAWRRRRAFNEAVLRPGTRHVCESDFLRYTWQAFEAPIHRIEDLRAAMGKAMLGVVFGGYAPPRLVRQIESLFGFVQNPLRRLLLAPWAYLQRARLYRTLSTLPREQIEGGGGSLMCMALSSAKTLEQTEFVQQIPHWMFTFTGSATDLLIRALALIGANPPIQARLVRELEVVKPLDGLGLASAELPYLEACLLEAAQLYPPVTKTFHRTPRGASVNSVEFLPGMEVMHLFPLFSSDPISPDGHGRSFRPDKWLRGAAPDCPFDPFLGGARSCPGRSVILAVCRVALASLLMRHRVVIASPGLALEPLPMEFPARGLRMVPRIANQEFA
jgi:cytochrome P450